MSVMAMFQQLIWLSLFSNSCDLFASLTYKKRK
jgi:hypothetical protein